MPLRPKFWTEGGDKLDVTVATGSSLRHSAQAVTGGLADHHAQEAADNAQMQRGDALVHSDMWPVAARKGPLCKLA